MASNRSLSCFHSYTSSSSSFFFFFRLFFLDFRRRLRCGSCFPFQCTDNDT